MTVREAITQADGLRPNQYSQEDKIRWLSEVEHSVFTDIILTHEIPFFLIKEKEIPEYHPLTKDDLDRELIAPYPYDKLYPAFIKMKVDENNMETDRYNASATLFNSYLDDYGKHINKTRKPLSRNAYHIY